MTDSEPTIPDPIADTLIEALESLDGTVHAEPDLAYSDADDVKTAMNYVTEHSESY